MSELVLDYEILPNKLVVQGEKFSPIVASSIEMMRPCHNVCQISVDMGLSSKLCFDDAKKTAKVLAEQGKRIIWSLDFKLLQDRVILDFEGHFTILKNNLYIFLEELLQEFSEVSFGVCLYKGFVTDLDCFPFTGILQEHFKEWLEVEYSALEKTLDKDHKKFVFMMNYFTEHLHRFSAILPDFVIPFVFFDTKAIQSPSRVYQLFSKMRFNHIELSLKNFGFPLSILNDGSCQYALGYVTDEEISVEEVSTKLGILLPGDEFCSNQLLESMDRVFNLLKDQGILFRVFPESLGMQYWDELENLLVFTEGLSNQGVRVVQGFLAASGSCIYSGKPLETVEAISLEEFLKGSG